MVNSESSPSRSFKVKIPPLSSTFVEVVQLYKEGNEGTAELDKLVALVRRDAATSAYVLRVVNSAYFGLKREVSQVERAVNLLGFESVCNVVMSMGLKETFTQLENDEVRGVYEYIMKCSVSAAAYARELAIETKFQLPDTAFAAGLVHQIGRLILLFNAPVAYPDLWYDPTVAGPDPKPPHRSEETERFDRDYVEVGVQVAREWHFPKILVTAIRYHRDPNGASGNTNRMLALLVAAAQQAGSALYESDESTSSAFFGLSVPLTRLARSRDVPPRDLVDLLVDRRQAVGIYTNSILASSPRRSS